MIVINTPQELVDNESSDFGVSEWRSIDSSIKSRFLESVSPNGLPASESAEVPGTLLLALIPQWLDEFISVENLQFGINYGLDDVVEHRRSTSSRFRMSLKINRVDQLSDDKYRSYYDFAIDDDIDGPPVLTGTFIGQYYF